MKLLPMYHFLLVLKLEIKKKFLYLHYGNHNSNAFVTSIYLYGNRYPIDSQDDN